MEEIIVTLAVRQKFSRGRKLSRTERNLPGFMRQTRIHLSYEDGQAPDSTYALIQVARAKALDTVFTADDPDDVDYVRLTRQHHEHQPIDVH